MRWKSRLHSDGYEELVYEPLNSNSENNPRISTYIIIRGSEAEYVQGMEYMDVLDGVRIIDFKNGRKIYNTLYRKFQEKNCECNEEEAEEHSIVISQLGPKKPEVTNTFYTITWKSLNVLG